MSKKLHADLAFTRESPYGTLVEPTYSGALSFMRRRFGRDLEGIDVAVSGIPFDTATTNRPGTRFGPRAIRAATCLLAEDPAWPWSFDPFERLAVQDYGDCIFDLGEPQETPAAIEAHATGILDQGTAMLTLGGDHFITYPLLCAHVKKHGPLSLIQFDAHSDTWEDDGNRIEHGTMFYRALKEGLVVPERSVQIGIRTTNDKTHGFHILDARWVQKNGPEATAAEIKRIVGDHKSYLTFDIDCLDPSSAPGTGTPVFGGLTAYQAQETLIGLEGINLVGMDLVEVSPAYDVGEITALAGASMALHMLCLYASQFPSRK